MCFEGLFVILRGPENLLGVDEFLLELLLDELLFDGEIMSVEAQRFQGVELDGFK